MSAATVDSGFVEAEFIEPGAAPVSEDTAAASTSKPKRSVRAFFRRIVDRTRGGHSIEKSDKDSQTYSRENVLTYQHTQPTFLDDTAGTKPPATEPGGLKTPDPQAPELDVPELELADLEPLDAEVEAELVIEPVDPEPLIFAEEEDEAAGPRTIGEQDFTIAFEGGLLDAEPGDLAPGDSAPPQGGDAESGGPRTITSSDLTIAFTPPEAVDDPIAGVIGVPSVVPEDDPNATRAVTDSDFTVAFVEDDAGFLDEPSSPIAGAIGPERIDPDVDEDDPTGTRRLSDSDFTIAFTPAEPENAADESQPPYSRPTIATGLTLDSADLATAAAASSGPDAPRPVTDSDYTFAFVEDDAEEKRDPRATHGIGATLNADELPAEEIERLTGMWEATISPEARPGMTIKAASPGSASQTHLVVRSRTVRAPEEPAPDGADYELLDTIGKGGMGVVYAARQASIDRTVAIKMIRRDMAGDADQRQKFLSEAVVTGDLDHPNIVPIYDLGSNESGALFYSMKRVEGTPWIKVLKKKSLSENVEILMKVADAVAFAHSRGVIHRDLKPENVMLGDFGEVLVMDWGLALLAPRFRHLGSITQSGGMGGTPAYMSPEMASGPLERIGVPSDVYLLGAILYEILTGKPPHAGKDVMSCLYAVARNEIQPTEVTGELMDIARRAMATEISERYESVIEFQSAIRLYHSHSESILLSDRAAEDLAKAEQSHDYQDYARAVFGFQEALSLWDGNERARSRLIVAKRSYAESAVAKGDLDLAASLLDPDEASYAELRTHVTAAQRDRDVRNRRFKLVVRAARALVATVVVIVTVAFFAIRAQREEAKAQAARADNEATNARIAEKEAEKQRDQAVASEQVAKEQRARAQAAENQATADRDKAIMAKQAAVEAEEAAVKARQVAVDAERAEARLRAQEEALRLQKEYDAYIASIGLVAAKIDENAFGYAQQLLNECQSHLRNWEWGRLMHLCRQSAQTFREQGPIDAVSYSPDGKHVVTGSWEGVARIWDVATGQPVRELKHGRYVHAVAYSPDGRFIATGSNDKASELKLWDAASGVEIRSFDGHTDAVLSVAFSRDGQRLLSSSYDKTARLWDVATGQQVRQFKGHTWWVWSAAFSPDESHVVTASQDGTAIVWSVDSDEKSAPFTGHAGPVYAAVFSPDGHFVATAGYDKRVLLWRPDQVRPFDFSTLLSQQSGVPTNYVAFVGHAAPVRCVRFSADGKTLLTAGHDNTVRLWDVASAVCRQTLRGHAGWVRSCSFSPDGQFVLSAGYDHQAKIWDVTHYEEFRLYGGHDDALLGATFSPDGKQIITVSRDRTAKIQDLVVGREATTLSEGHAFLVSTVAFSPDGSRVFTGAGDDTIRVWDAVTGGELRHFEHTGRGGIFALSRDGRLMLSGGEGNDALLWDVATGNTLHKLAGHRSEVTAVAISTDGKLLFTGDAVGRGRIWDAATGKQLHLLSGHSRKITAAHFLASGKRVLTASSDNSVGQWDVATGQELPAQVLKHPDGVTAMTTSWEGRFAITACADKHIRLWNLDGPRVVRDIDAGNCAISSVALSADGRRVLTACADNKVRLWDLASGMEVKNPRPQHAHGALVDTGHSAVWTAVFSPDGTHVATAGGNDATLWRVDNGREVMSYSPHGAVAAGAFSPDGQHAATCSWDGTIKIWNAKTGNVELKIVASPEKYVNSVMYSPDGSRLLSASDDATAKIWDAKTGKLLLSLPTDENAAGHQDTVRSARYSADGKRVVTASSDKTARVWDAETGESLAVLEGHEWAVLAAEFSADGTRIITGSEDNTVRIWDAATGKQLLLLEGHTAPVTSVAFTPDGTRAATGAQDNAVKLWDAKNGKEILHLKQHSQEVSSVAFSPDGKLLLTSSRDGTAIVWPAVDWQ
ncbi:MAG TPA: protein kinase [Pirellulales bacterium]|nr:protein kinase [Pirellulales bacterium]